MISIMKHPLNYKLLKLDCCDKTGENITCSSALSLLFSSSSLASFFCMDEISLFLLTRKISYSLRSLSYSAAYSRSTEPVDLKLAPITRGPLRKELRRSRALGFTSTGISQASPPSPPYPSSITSPGLTREDAVPMVAAEKHYSAFSDAHSCSCAMTDMTGKVFIHLGF